VDIFREEEYRLRHSCCPVNSMRYDNEMEYMVHVCGMAHILVFKIGTFAEFRYRPTLREEYFLSSPEYQQAISEIGKHRVTKLRHMGKQWL
jgi:hypothetical protein